MTEQEYIEWYNYTFLICGLINLLMGIIFIYLCGYSPEALLALIIGTGVFLVFQFVTGE
jgi:putative flippase GtrA